MSTYREASKYPNFQGAAFLSIMAGIGRLIECLWQYRRRYLLGGLCLAGTTSLLMMVPWWVRAAIEVIERGDPESELGGYVLLTALAAAGGGLLRGISRSIIFNAGRNIEYDLRNDLFAHLEKLPLSYYQSQRTGDLMSRAVNDINAVRMLLGPGFLNLVNTPLYFGYAAVFMFAMNVQLTLAVAACLTLLVWVFGQFRGRIQRASLRVQRQMSRMSAHVQENLSGMHVVKAYVQAEPQTARFAGLNDEYRVRSMDLARCRGMINPLMVALHGLTVLVVLWYGGWLILRQQTGVADLVAFFLYLNVLAWPMAAFGWMISLIERGRAAMERLEEIFEVEPVHCRSGTPSAPDGPGAGHRVRERVVCLQRRRRGGAPGHQLRGAAGPQGGHRRTHGFGQEHPDAPDPAPVRRHLRRRPRGRASISGRCPWKSCGAPSDTRRRIPSCSPPPSRRT